MAGETVKGAPYSAEAITEITQILPDGSHVTIKASTRVYRDSQGRERREQALDPATGLSATPKRAPTVQIYDPVAQANYTLNVLGHFRGADAHAIDASAGFRQLGRGKSRGRIRSQHYFPTDARAWRRRRIPVGDPPRRSYRVDRSRADRTESRASSADLGHSDRAAGAPNDRRSDGRRHPHD